MAKLYDVARKDILWKANGELVKNTENTFGIPLPEVVVNDIKNRGGYLKKIIVMTFEEFDAKFPHEAVPEHSCFKYGKHSKTGMDIMYVYSPNHEAAVIQKKAEALEKQRQNAWNHNKNVVEKFKKYFGLTELPAELTEQIKLVSQKFEKMFLIPFEEFQARFDGDANQICMALADEDQTTGIPLLYVYVPGLSDKKARTANVNKIARHFKNTFEVEASEELKNFIFELPGNIPHKASFWGVREHVKKFTENPDAKLYGDVDANIFAVEYVWNDEPSIAFYISNLEFSPVFYNKVKNSYDFPEEIAKRISLNAAPMLCAKLMDTFGLNIEDAERICKCSKPMVCAKLLDTFELSIEDAMHICDALPDNEYYGIYNTYSNDFSEYAMKMAKLLNVKEGTEVIDLIQGPVEVVIHPKTKKAMLNLDDEQPSAILIGKNINVFVP